MHDWQYFFNHDRSNLNQGTYRIFEPEWKADILHWFSQKDVAKEQKEDFIQALRDFDDGCGDFYRYRAYFLAAEALSQFPECSLGDVIVGQLLKWSYAYFRQDQRDWQILPKPLVKTARKTLELTDRKRVIAAFVHLVHTTESRTVLRVAAEKLGTLDPGNKSAIAALALMPISENRYGFCQRSYSLGKIAVGNETAIAVLVNDIKKIPDQGTCVHRIMALGDIAYGNQTAIAALVHLMETTLNKDNCCYAITALKQIAVGDQTAIAALVKFLQINQGDRICLNAARALWQIDPGNAAVPKTLVHILETSANASLMDCAATYLLEIEPVNKTAMPTVSFPKTVLLEIIENTECESLRCTAATHLGELDPGNQVVFSTLSQLLDTTQDENLRLSAAKSLVEIDPDNQKAITSLWQILQSYKYRWMHVQAARQLVKIGEYDRVINTLCELANLEDEYKSQTAIDVLKEIEPSHPLAINADIHLINTNKDTSILIRAADNLEQLDPDNKQMKAKFNEVIFSLMQCIQTFEECDQNQDDFYPNANTKLSYESCLFDIADSLTRMLQSEHLPQVVITLKDYLGKQFYKNSSYRYEAIFKIIWHCAQNLTYPDFHKAIN